MNNVRFLGEYISIGVAISWTITALLSEIGSKRFGALTLNVIRMVMALAFISITLYFMTGYAYPVGADSKAWLWLSLSGLVGYVFGDMCLFNAYVSIGSRFGQLFMTTAPAAAAVAGYLMLGEHISLQALLGMTVTMIGIGISVISKGDKESKHKVALKLPLKGILLGLGAGIGQGVGLVLSKVGMDYYQMPTGTPNAEFALPFASTFIRGVTGLAGFLIIAIMLHKTESLRKAATDRKGMFLAALLTIFGPFVGVSLSLMAVRYTAVGIAQTLMELTPIMILLPAYLIFHQKVTWIECLGAVISVAGVTLFFI